MPWSAVSSGRRHRRAAPPFHPNRISARRRGRQQSSPSPGTEGSNPSPSNTESVSAVNSRAVGEKPRAFAAVCTRSGREGGTGWLSTRSVSRFSLKGIDAVPSRGFEANNDARPRQSRPGCLRGCAVQLARSWCCSAQSSGRSSSLRRAAVSATGCRPSRIASTSRGLKKARSIRRRM